MKVDKASGTRLSLLPLFALWAMPMTTSTFTILLGGHLAITDRLRAELAGSRFIAADSGMKHAEELGVTPELWVGDFDSTDAALAARWPGVERQPYPPAKNETDGEIATAEAILRGANRLIFAGAIGGERSDHLLQHFVYAMSLAERGLDILLTSGEEEAVPLLPGKKVLDLPKGSLFSIIGFSALEGLDITGARYPLKQFGLPFGSSRTVSNIAEGPVEFSLFVGRAMIIARPHDFSGA
jgi:thiamine pyrophosphokinase